MSDSGVSLIQRCSQAARPLGQARVLLSTPRKDAQGTQTKKGVELSKNMLKTITDLLPVMGFQPGSSTSGP